MADRRWGCDPDDLDGAAYTGAGPGLRTESRGHLMLTYLTDIRGERIVVVQVTWFG